MGAYRGDVRPLEARRSGGVLAGAAGAHRLGPRAGRGARLHRAPLYRWFPDGRLNTCYNALDRHVERRPRRPAGADLRLPVTGDGAHATPTAELRDEVARFAGALRGSGSGSATGWCIYMPMVPEAVIAMLACARLGAVHSVVFGGFAPAELAARIDDAPAEGDRLRVVRHRGRPGGRVQAAARRALELADTAPRACVVLQRPQLPAAAARPAGMWSWDDAMAGARAGRLRAGGGDRSAVHPLHVRHHRACRRASCATTAATRSRWPGRWRNVYDIGPGDVLGGLRRRLGGRPLLHRVRAAAAPARRRCSTRANRSARPDAGAFWRVVAEHGVNALFTAPTAIRAIKRDDPPASWPARPVPLRTLFLAGERLDPDTLRLGAGASACR